MKRKYKIYCQCCNTYKSVTKEELEQIKASQICPVCHEEIKTGTKDHQYNETWIMLEKEKEIFGYRVKASWKFGCKGKIEHLEQVLYQKEKTYRKNCVRGMYYNVYETKTDGWRRCRDDYTFAFYSLYSRSRTKKQYYENIFNDGNYKLKSNQKKLIQDNLFNRDQIAAIIIFDLKEAKDLIKYRRYIRSNHLDVHLAYSPTLNVHYLDYLSRNKIAYNDFKDYARQCETLGYKLDKPKDFQRKHAELSAVFEAKRNSKYQSRIKKRFKNLIKNSYTNGSIEIKPFKSAEEIIVCGKMLHNCIGQYIPQYATEKTDLYYMNVEGEQKVAIEVKQKTLIQAREDMNATCQKEYLKHIRTWCKDNNFKYSANAI